MNDVMIPGPTDLAGHIQTLESEDETRAKLREEIKALGVKEVDISYHGGGDEGNIEDAVFSISDTSKLKVPYDLTRRFSDWAWDFICGYHGGFENNEGGFGTLTWDIASGAITLDHNDYIQESEQTLHEGV
ncbi:DUF6878 family protein [Phaeobacter piscinae]|uniref:DUF6878 family protein n=1 Tax=Phaeobacter piscinae TaxID=1580596 RepID=UPI0006934A9D|nr:DUF6878 family protein [Phaeobacter piscinae]UTS82732.1 hypothetical protein OL67_003842 [Phaeobacter piscinae]